MAFRDDDGGGSGVDAASVERDVLRHAQGSGLDADNADCRPKQYPEDEWTCDVVIGVSGGTAAGVVTFDGKARDGELTFTRAD